MSAPEGGGGLVCVHPLGQLLPDIGGKPARRYYQCDDCLGVFKLLGSPLPADTPCPSCQIQAPEWVAFHGSRFRELK